MSDIRFTPLQATPVKVLPPTIKPINEALPEVLADNSQAPNSIANESESTAQAYQDAEMEPLAFHFDQQSTQNETTQTTAINLAATRGGLAAGQGTEYKLELQKSQAPDSDPVISRVVSLRGASTKPLAQSLRLNFPDLAGAQPLEASDTASRTLRYGLKQSEDSLGTGAVKLESALEWNHDRSQTNGEQNLETRNRLALKGDYQTDHDASGTTTETAHLGVEGQNLRTEGNSGPEASETTTRTLSYGGDHTQIAATDPAASTRLQAGLEWQHDRSETATDQTVETQNQVALKGDYQADQDASGTKIETTHLALEGQNVRTEHDNHPDASETTTRRLNYGVDSRQIAAADPTASLKLQAGLEWLNDYIQTADNQPVETHNRVSLKGDYQADHDASGTTTETTHLALEGQNSRTLTERQTDLPDGQGLSNRRSLETRYGLDFASLNSTGIESAPTDFSEINASLGYTLANDTTLTGAESAIRSGYSLGTDVSYKEHQDGVGITTQTVELKTDLKVEGAEESTPVPVEEVPAKPERSEGNFFRPESQPTKTNWSAGLEGDRRWTQSSNGQFERSKALIFRADYGVDQLARRTQFNLHGQVNLTNMEGLNYGGHYSESLKDVELGASLNRDNKRLSFSYAESPSRGHFGKVAYELKNPDADSRLEFSADTAGHLGVLYEVNSF